MIICRIFGHAWDIPAPGNPTRWQCRRCDETTVAPAIQLLNQQIDKARLTIHPPFLVKGEPETCICAAVRTTKGQVIRGHRHGDCLAAIRSRHMAMDKVKDAQGFITSMNRFVDRKEGLELQKSAGIQSLNPRGYGHQLMSEDL